MWRPRTPLLLALEIADALVTAELPAIAIATAPDAAQTQHDTTEHDIAQNIT